MVDSVSVTSLVSVLFSVTLLVPVDPFSTPAGTLKVTSIQPVDMPGSEPPTGVKVRRVPDWLTVNVTGEPAFVAKEA